ncbi:hypothetical protein EDD22DRAFT_978988 [Suillus occidentalis]|nr:hypothetical protein EDD22DRAFT_978988 [Suillus occidentalis]
MYMNEFLRLEGRGQDSDTPCACGVEDAVFRCQDCFSLELACRSCTIGLHHNSPLHRIKEWRGGFFHAVSLKSMGLRIQLGHPPGITCRRPTTAFGDDFVIIDVHGVHPTGLDFCRCEQEVSHFKQLLRARLFPSTVTDPRTAATFASKVSAYEFYHSLARRTDNTGITPIHDRYSVFLRIVREWRNIKALKRSGHGHHPAGIDSAREIWLFSALHARIQEKTFLKSNCVNHNAVNMADTKSSRGLAATGVGTNSLPSRTINFSYNIACQWHKKLWDHLPTLPPHLQFDPEGKTINFFVPKLNSLSIGLQE